MHSGITTLTVSPESIGSIPWNSPIIKFFSVFPEKQPVKVRRHSRRCVHEEAYSAGSMEIDAPVTYMTWIGSFL